MASNKIVYITFKRKKIKVVQVARRSWDTVRVHRCQRLLKLWNTIIKK